MKLVASKNVQSFKYAPQLELATSILVTDVGLRVGGTFEMLVIDSIHCKSHQHYDSVTIITVAIRIYRGILRLFKNRWLIGITRHGLLVVLVI